MQALIPDNKEPWINKLRIQCMKSLYSSVFIMSLKRCTDLLELCSIADERMLGDKLFHNFGAIFRHSVMSTCCVYAYVYIQAQSNSMCCVYELLRVCAPCIIVCSACIHTLY